jgi:hypothetical protein
VIEMGESAAIIHFGGTTTPLVDKAEIWVGRGSNMHIRVGRNPTDSRVSREHVVLSMSSGLVTVTRKSLTQPVIVRSTSSDYWLEAPNEAVTRGGAFEVLLPKTPDIGEAQPAYYRITILAPGPGDSAPEGSLLAERSDRTTRTAALPQLTTRERQLLAAYAWPLIRADAGSRKRPATHREAAASLNYGYDWVREQIDGLRIRLAAEGWPVGPDKDSLCHWAVAARLISANDIAEFQLD